MIVTDPEYGTREWSEDPVGDLMKMRQIIIDSFEKITESVKRFCEGLDDLTYTLFAAGNARMGHSQQAPLPDTQGSTKAPSEHGAAGHCYLFI